MATSSSSSSETATDESTTPTTGEVFEYVIWADPEVCNNCFARFRSLTAFDDELRHTATEPTADGCYDYAIEEHGDSAALRDHDPRSTCEECGSVSGLVTTDTLSAREALARVEPLADRLQEAGYDVSECAMTALICEVKSREDLQGRDREMFRRAVKLGLEYA